MLKILIVVDAPGPAEFIAPVIPELRSKNYQLKIVTVGNSPTKILSKYKPIRIDKESEVEPIYNKINPDILLVAMSSLVTGPFVNPKFTELAYRDGKKIICFQDLWGNHRWPVNFKVMKYWDAILTLDNFGKKLILEDGYRGKVYAAGSPAFDRFRKINVAQERKRLRKKFHISENAFVIFYAGAGTPAGWQEDEITFKFLASAIKKLINSSTRELIFIAHPHPRDEKPNRYQKLAPDLKYFDASKIVLSEEVLPMVDVVVGMYATNLIHACYLRIPGISILLPNAGGKRLFENISLKDFPTNAMGATIGIYQENVGTLVEEFNKLMNGSPQRKFFRFGKKTATEKVAAVLKQLIQE
jgi:hypothetical protein